MKYSREEAKEIILNDIAKLFVGMPNNDNTKKLMEYEIRAQLHQMIREGKVNVDDFNINIKGDLNL